MRALFVLGAAIALSGPALGNYSWNFGSGLFPDQVDPTMVSNWGSRDLRPDGLYVRMFNPFDMSYYEQSGANVIRPEHFVLRTRLRVMDEQSQIPEVRSGTMFNVNLGNNVGVTFGIGVDTIYYLNSANNARLGVALVDTNDAFHDYRLEIATVTRNFTLFQDDAPILNGVTPGYGNSAPSIWWGDGTQYAAGLGIWQSFEHNAAAVPEPASLLGLVVGLAALGRSQQRKQSGGRRSIRGSDRGRSRS